MWWLDLALVVLVVIALASGTREGFSRSGFGLLAVVLALACAAWSYPANPKGFVLVFVGVLGAGAAGAFLMGRWFQRSGLGWVDKLLGGAFGVANALFIWVVVVLALFAFSPRHSRDIARSSFAPFAVEAACTVAEFVPDQMKKRFAETYAELRRALPPRLRGPRVSRDI